MLPVSELYLRRLAEDGRSAQAIPVAGNGRISTRKRLQTLAREFTRWSTYAPLLLQTHRQRAHHRPVKAFKYILVISQETRICYRDFYAASLLSFPSDEGGDRDGGGQQRQNVNRRPPRWDATRRSHSTICSNVDADCRAADRLAASPAPHQQVRSLRLVCRWHVSVLTAPE